MAGEPIITVFRSRLRSDANANGYGELSAQVEALARSMPGLVDFKMFTAEDGERVSVVIFDDAENHEAWRDLPEHRIAQQRGRDEFYAEYSIWVCTQRDFRSFSVD